MAKEFITLHIVSDIPWSNLNRDDTGTPKRTLLGGVERGMLSSQSLKRAARRDYERRVLELFPQDFVAYEGLASQEEVAKASSLRSRYLVEWAVNRAEEIALERGLTLDRKKALRVGNGFVKKLTGGEDTILWLSLEELETLASLLSEDVAEGDMEAVTDLVFSPGRTTGSLAIAAFGRMFASSVDHQTDAAVAVSPAISTHGNIIETDYFTAADDYGFFSKSKSSGEVTRNVLGAGAAHLGTAFFTHGIFYRTVTIDVKELHRNWTAMGSEHSQVLLTQFVESLVRSLPTGKKNSSAPYTVPTLVVAQEQGYREAYSIAKPVQATAEGGFLTPTLEALAAQHKRALAFNGDNYGRQVVSGSEAESFSEATVELSKLISSVVEWLQEYEVPKHLETPTVEVPEAESANGKSPEGESPEADPLTLEEE